MNRRRFVKGAVAAFSARLFAQGGLNVSIGAWPLEVSDSAMVQIPGIREIAQNIHFAHLYIKISADGESYYLHGFPADSSTHERRDFSNLQGSVLQVALLNEKEHQAERHRVCHEQLDEKPLPIGTSVSAPHILAETLDMGEAINNAHLSYQPISLSRQNPPVNSNAVAAAMLGAIHACPPDSCHPLETLYPGYFVPGVNGALIQRVNIGTRNQRAADKGTDMPSLARDFKGRNPMVFLPTRNTPTPCLAAALAYRP